LAVSAKKKGGIEKIIEKREKGLGKHASLRRAVFSREKEGFLIPARAQFRRVKALHHRKGRKSP